MPATTTTPAALLAQLEARTATWPAGKRQAAFRALRVELARRQAAARFRTPGQLAAALDKRTVQTPALDLIDAELVEVAAGRLERLAVSMPPQEGKSERISHYTPLWLLIRNPELRIGIVSFESDAAQRWGRTIRNDLLTHNGADGNLDLGLRLATDSKAAGRWQLAGHRGGVYSVGVGGSLTGRPIDVLFIDDPHKDKADADSELRRKRVWDWWESVAVPRLAPGAPVVVIMTRWHEDDLVGRLVAKDAQDERDGIPGLRWTVLNIPAQADHDPGKGQTDPLGRQPGEFMVSARGRSTEQWEQRKRDAGGTWTALFQGRPSPAEGAVWRKTWWRRWETAPYSTRPDGTCWMPDAEEVIQSWDMTFKDARDSDFVVGQVWARKGAEAFLLDQVRARLDFVSTVAAFRRLTVKWPQATAKLVEDKANGPAVISQLGREIGGIIAVPATDSKLARASAVAPFIEARNVWVPDDAAAAWAHDFVDESAVFPNGAHDDQVDAASQALHRLLLRPGQGSLFIDAWRAMASAPAPAGPTHPDARPPLPEARPAPPNRL